MRRIAGIVVPLVVIVALLAGFAIGHMAGGSSSPSPKIDVLRATIISQTSIASPSPLIHETPSTAMAQATMAPATAVSSPASPAPE